MVVFHNLLLKWWKSWLPCHWPQSHLLFTSFILACGKRSTLEEPCLHRDFFFSFFFFFFVVPLSQAIRHLTYNRTGCSVFTPQHFLNIHILQMPAPSLFSQFCICLSSKAPLQLPTWIWENVEASPLPLGWPGPTMSSVFHSPPLRHFPENRTNWEVPVGQAAEPAFQTQTHPPRIWVLVGTGFCNPREIRFIRRSAPFQPEPPQTSEPRVFKNQMLFYGHGGSPHPLITR